MIVLQRQVRAVCGMSQGFFNILRHVNLFSNQLWYMQDVSRNVFQTSRGYFSAYFECEILHSYEFLKNVT
jgi:hypothetical protein